MSVSPMKFISIIGPLEEFEQVVRSCVINWEFYPENASKALGAVRRLSPFDQKDPYSDLLAEAKRIAGVTGLTLDCVDFMDSMPLDIQDAESCFLALEERFAHLGKERFDLQELIRSNDLILRQLSHFREMDASYQSFFQFTYVRVRFGRMPRESFDCFRQTMDDRQDLFFFPTGVETEYVYGVCLTPRLSVEQVDSFLALLLFERIYISDKVQGSAVEAIKALEDENANAEKRLAEIEKERQSLLDTERESFLRYYSYISYMEEAFAIGRYAAHSQENFYLAGWTPATELDSFTDALEAFPSVHCNVNDPEHMLHVKPPVKLHNARVFKPFEDFVSMYGLPSYDELDPTPIMAITYTLVFGMMFGDAGQGLVLALIGYVLWKLRRMWLGRILVYAGFSSFFFGLLYNSFFGLEGFFPYEGFSVMDNTNTILLVAVALGCTLLSLAMVLNIANGIRQKDWQKSFFSANGLAGLILYWALIISVLKITGFWDGPLSFPVLAALIVLSLTLIFLGEPLGKALSGKRALASEGIGEYVMENLFELVDVLLSYMTNTISFLRVGAFALSHAGMMLVVYQLARGGGGVGSTGNPVVIVLGNLLVMGIEGLLVGIQVLRLEFYEIFGRFYTGDGEQFIPSFVDHRPASF